MLTWAPFVASSSRGCQGNLQKQVQNEEAQSLLGMEIVRNQDLRIIMLHQTAKIDAALKEFKMGDCHPCTTPMEVKPILGKVAVTQHEDAHLPYRNLVGTLLAIWHSTRAGITFAVNVLSQHFKGWSHTHWIAVKRVLRYIKGKGTKDYGLCYSFNQASGS